MQPWVISKSPIAWRINHTEHQKFRRLTIVKVLVVVPIRAKVDVVNPDLARSLDADVITRSQDLRDLEVTDDNVIRVQYSETNTSEGYSEDNNDQQPSINRHKCGGKRTGRRESSAG